VNLEQFLERLETRPPAGTIRRFALPPRRARTVPLPDDLHPDLAAALRAQGIGALYVHQARALAEARRGRHTVVVTPTASGKTLCYNLPVLDRLLKTGRTTALYVYPTKALAQDQRAALGELLRRAGWPDAAWTYDGDTPADARSAVRDRGHLVLTNPDMLHAAILPHHARWARLFQGLEFVVLDEVHHYRGVFGSHLANVIRRLKRICAFYGSRPTFLCTSATIGNPAELAGQLVGEDVVLVDESGAPSGPRHVLVYNPPVVNAALGIRRSALLAAVDWAHQLLAAGIPTIVFSRSRLAVELLLTYLRERVGERVAGYRGGYLPRERRAVERALREGDLLGVVATNALELGVDVGSLQACVIHGYPGSVASTWQQAGRAGRREEPSAVVLVATSDPLDQYLAEHPEYLLETPPEAGYVNPDNLFVLMSHVKCAAFELPFSEGERFGSAPLADVLDFLAEEGVLRRVGSRWYWMADHFPAADVSLRSAAQENVVVVDRSDGARVLGEVDLFSAPLLVHEDAIYLHGGRQYQVERLDFAERKAYVRRVDVDYYTDAQLAVELRVLDVAGEGAGRGWGEVLVTAKATLFKKVRLHTHENVGWGRIHLPEQQMHTTAYWASLPPSAGPDPLLGPALDGLARVLGSLAPLFCLCDPRDVAPVAQVRSPFTGLPTVFLYETVPGGVGLAEKLFAAHEPLARAAAERIAACPCEDGCPSCVGPGEPGVKDAALALARLLAGAATPPAAPVALP
jgi:DEAD/DEAH box helicase domain-containing protein